MFPKTFLPTLFGFLLLTSVATHAAPPGPQLIKDIAPGQGIPQFSTNEQSKLAAIGNRVFFTWKHADTGEELWVSDGTPESSRLVKDIRPGITSSQIREMIVSGGKLFFVANDGTHGWELWVSDGTESGTTLVKDLVTNPFSGNVPTALKAFNGGVAFASASDTGVTAVWWSDGTAAHTRRLQSLIREATTYWTFYEDRWDVMGSYLYFGTEAGSAGSTDTALWRTDGTVAGTTQLRVFPNASREPVTMGSVGSELYFSVSSPGPGYSLWKTDGTEAGTVPVGGIGNTVVANPLSPVIDLGGKGYFLGGYYLQHGIWETDGTAAGTQYLNLGFPPSQRFLIAPFGNRLWVTTVGNYDTNTPSKIYLMDPATHALTPVPSSGGFIGAPISQGNRVWYTKAYLGQSEFDLYVYDGTQETRVQSGMYYVLNHSVTEEGLFFSAHTTNGPVVWKSPATAPYAAVQLTPAYVPAASSNPRSFVKCGNLQLFAATSPEAGEELWVTDGTPTGTHLVKDLVPGASGSSPASLTVGPEGIVYFGATNANGGSSLWRTDGTDAGTWEVKEAIPDANLAQVRNLVCYGSRIYFEASDTIWSSKGTAGGADTLPLGSGDLVPWTTSDDGIGEMVWPTAILENRLYFFSWTSEGNTLFRVSEQSDGTVQVAEVATGSFEPRSLIVAPVLHLPGKPNQLYFMDQNAGGGIFRCNGVDAPVPLTLMANEDFADSVKRLVIGDGRLVVETGEPTNGNLWVASPTGDSLIHLTVGNLTGTTQSAIFYWVWDTDEFRISSIRADGSHRTLLTEAPKSTPWYFPQLLAQDDMLVFSVDREDSTTREVWVSLGTAETTQRIPGVIFDSFIHVALQNGKLLLGAYEEEPAAGGAVGQELYAVDFPDFPQQIFAAAGGPVILKAGYGWTDSSATYLWRKNGQNAGTTAALRFFPASLTNAGSYTVRRTPTGGTASTYPVDLAIFQPLPALSRVRDGGNITLTTAAAGPKGSVFSYQWLRNGEALSDSHRFKGSQTARLTGFGLSDQYEDAGIYTCRITFTLNGISLTRSTQTELRLVTQPDISLPESLIPYLDELILGEQLDSEPLVLDQAEFSDVTIKGLPAGLTYDPATGKISGKPLKAGPFTLTLTVKNPAGSSSTIVKGTILPALKPGSYDALVDRVALSETAPGLGSRVLLTVAPTGTVSGQLFHDGKVYRFAGQPVTQDTGRDSDLTIPASLIISRGKNQPAITLTFSTGDSPSITLADARTGTETTGSLRSPVFSVKRDGRKITQYGYRGSSSLPVRSYNVILSSEELSGIPQGRGFIQISLKTDGGAMWAGTLADGTRITGSGALSAVPGEESSQIWLAIHQDLYKSTGSLHGWTSLNGLDYAETTEHIHVDGSLTWNKAALPANSKERNSKDGIPLHSVGASGAPWQGLYPFGIVPEPGQTTLPVELVIQTEDTGEIRQPFTVSTKLASPPLPATLTTVGHSLSFNRVLGTFTGKLTLPNENPALVRKVTVYGLLDPLNGMAAGFFLLPDLPSDPPGTTLSTSPIRSARIQIQPRYP